MVTDPTGQPPRLRPLVLQWAPIVAAGMVYFWFIAHPDAWNHVIWPQSLARHGLVFLDLDGHLASSAAHAQGTLVDGQPVPGDRIGRVHAGPRWMLWLGYVGLTPVHTLPFAAGCLIAFLVTAALVHRPTSVGAAIYWFAVLTGPPLMLLVERGNIDLLVFAALALACAGFVARAAVWRWMSWAVVAGFIGFKYYPSLAFGALLESRGAAREKIVALVLAALATGAFVFSQLEEIRYVSVAQGGSIEIPFFGARELPLLLGLPKAGPVTFLAIGLAIAGALTWLLGPLAEFERAWDARKATFITGAAILAFSFVMTTSPDYRLVFFLFCVPWLWVCSEQAESGRVRLAARLALGIMIVAPWLGVLGMRAAAAVDSAAAYMAVILVKQVGWWLLVGIIAALLFRLIATSVQRLVAEASPPPDAPH